MRILCVCRAGVVRSVALAKILKELFNQDALSVSWQYNSKETLDILYNWADKIVVVVKDYKVKIPSKYWSKLSVTDIGEDNWHDATNPELIDKIYAVLAKRNDLTNG
ncbi:hypothetical protein HYT58_01275 [Candidatus Woesearchaeota archaeon]|nr:hypothetical protein [Candidatus Woesearchaeota archaeon]